jgi:hypothetical protein
MNESAHIQMTTCTPTLTYLSELLLRLVYFSVAQHGREDLAVQVKCGLLPLIGHGCLQTRDNRENKPTRRSNYVPIKALKTL